MSSRRLSLAVAILGAVLLVVPPVAAQSPPPEREPFSETINYGDCRDYPAPCVQDPWTGNLSISPHLIHEGESITLSFALEPGGVSFSMPGGGKGCDFDEENRPTEVQGKDGRWQVEDTDVRTGGTCTLKPGSTNGRWSTMSVGVTGPCGSQIAVQEGRAEYASCAGTFASDYFGVIGKDDDRYGISGQVRLSSGRAMAGVPITVSGPESKSTVTGPGGDYSFLVKKGTYSVRAGAKVCVTPGPRECTSSKSVTVPASQSVNFMPEGEGVIRGTVLGENSKPKSGVDVRIVGPDGLTVRSDDKGQYEARLPKGAYTLTATETVTPPALPGAKGPPQPVVSTYCADDNGTFPKKCQESVRVEVPPDQSVNWARKADPDDIQVNLEGRELVKGESFLATVTLENPRDEDIAEIGFESPSGIGIESLVEFSGAPVVPDDGAGPPPTLPTHLGAKESVTLKLRYLTPNPGQVVMTTNLGGKGVKTKQIVKGTAAMSVSAGKPITDDDIQRKAVSDLDGLLSLTAQKQRELDAVMAKAIADRTKAAGPTKLDQAVADQLGIPVELASLMNATADKGDEAAAFWSSYGKEFRAEVDKRGKAGGEFLYAASTILTDPVAMDAFSKEVVAGAKKMAPEVLLNMKYLGEAWLAAHTLEGAKTVIDANVKMLADVATAMDQARVGFTELQKDAAVRYKKDPLGFRREEAKLYATATVTGLQESMFAALGEAGTRTIAAVAPRVLEVAGLRRVQTAEQELEGAAAATDGTLVAAGDEAAAAAERLANAEKAFQTLQELPEGKALSSLELLEQGGIRAEDAAEIDSILGEVEEKFGVKLEIGARTSEPLSAGIDGVGKREFIKPKAISALDKLLGGEESLAGRASVFEPKMPSDEILEGLEAKVPGIKDKLQARFNDQKDLFDKFQDPNSALRQLVEGSEKVVDKEGRKVGVTALVERPGHTFPSELGKVKGKPEFAYLEQLDDPAFLESRGLSPDRAGELKTQLSKFPDQVRTRLDTKVVGDTTTFVEGLSGKPIVSDLDLQFVVPKEGWPPGMRGQIESYVNARMKKSARFPHHGWSDAALDVPAEITDVAAKFTLQTTNPAFAKAEAQALERQFKEMAGTLRKKAERAVDEASKKKMIETAEKFEKLTADELLKKYKPGEKIIIFSKGDARVGYSGGRK